LGINTMNKVSEEFPISVYGKDFNADGLFDAIPTVFFPDKDQSRHETPFHTRDDLIKQMTVLREKFDNYDKYAKANIEEVLSGKDLKDALVLKANIMETIYIENLGEGEFKITSLPIQAQTAPVFGMLIEDFNVDGNLDILMVGNDFGNEVSVGRLDAFNGLLLAGNGQGSFKPLTLSQTAFLVSGDAKGLVRVSNAQGKPIIMATQNKGALKSFSLGKSLQTEILKSNDAVVIENLKNGKKRKTEINYGTSFLSQSSRSILLSPNVKSVEVVDYQGKKRSL